MELATLSIEPCYVYANIPPADACGHRANAWNVENWTQVETKPTRDPVKLVLHRRSDFESSPKATSFV